MSTDFRSILLDWYRSTQRDLPWRESRDPYRVWISEIMLQQTVVKAVIPYYEKWMIAFPTVEALASAPLETVLAHWQGLGYYSRCRNLHEESQAMACEGMPASYEEWLQIKGSANTQPAPSHRSHSMIESQRSTGMSSESMPGFRLTTAQGRSSRLPRKPGRPNSCQK
jgi:hypothetical protein